MRDTRHELIEAAEVLVRTRGYSGFSFAQLSDVVGIKKASVHHYFKTKDDLARALIAAYDKRFDDDLETIKTKSDDAIDRIQAYGTLYVSGVEKSLGCLIAVMATEFVTLPDTTRADLSAFFAKHNKWLETVLKEGVRKGQIRSGLDIPASARLIVSTLQGALMMERVIGNPASFKKVLKTLLKSFSTLDLKPAKKSA